MLNKHDEYVAAAIAGLCAHVRIHEVEGDPPKTYAKRIARLAHDVADAAMEEGARRNMEKK